MPRRQRPALEELRRFVPPPREPTAAVAASIRSFPGTPGAVAAARLVLQAMDSSAREAVNCRNSEDVAVAARTAVRRRAARAVITTVGTAAKGPTIRRAERVVLKERRVPTAIMALTVAAAAAAVARTRQTARRGPADRAAVELIGTVPMVPGVEEEVAAAGARPSPALLQDQAARAGDSAAVAADRDGRITRTALAERVAMA